jgi:hypothetical protein
LDTITTATTVATTTVKMNSHLPAVDHHQPMMNHLPLKLATSLILPM